MAYLNSNKIDELCNEVGEENLPVLLEIFLTELYEYQEILTKESEDLEYHLSNISHALKSSAASFGADDLCQFALGIDKKLKASKPMPLLEVRDAMLLNLQATIDIYSTLGRVDLSSP